MFYYCFSFKIIILVVSRKFDFFNSSDLWIDIKMKINDVLEKELDFFLNFLCIVFFNWFI